MSIGRHARTSLAAFALLLGCAEPVPDAVESPAVADVPPPRALGPSSPTPLPRPPRMELDVVPAQAPAPDVGPALSGRADSDESATGPFLLEFGATRSPVPEAVVAADGRAELSARSAPGTDLGLLLQSAPRSPNRSSLSWSARSVVRVSARGVARLQAAIEGAQFWTVAASGTRCALATDAPAGRRYIHVRTPDHNRRVEFRELPCGLDDNASLHALFEELRSEVGSGTVAEQLPIARIAAAWIREPTCIASVAAGGFVRLEAVLSAAGEVDDVLTSGDLADVTPRECLSSRLRAARWRGEWPDFPRGVSLVEAHLILTVRLRPEPVDRRREP